jgi:hypothetical protein
MRIVSDGINTGVRIIRSTCPSQRYAYCQPLHLLTPAFAQHIGMDSITTVCNSLLKVTKIPGFNVASLSLQEPLKMQSAVVGVRVR